MSWTVPAATVVPEAERLTAVELKNDPPPPTCTTPELVNTLAPLVMVIDSALGEPVNVGATFGRSDLRSVFGAPIPIREPRVIASPEVNVDPVNMPAAVFPISSRLAS